MAEWSKTLMQIQVAISPLQTQVQILVVFTKKECMQVEDYENYLNEDNNRLIHRLIILHTQS